MVLVDSDGPMMNNNTKDLTNGHGFDLSRTLFACRVKSIKGNLLRCTCNRIPWYLSIEREHLFSLIHAVANGLSHYLLARANRAYIERMITTMLMASLSRRLPACDR